MSNVSKQRIRYVHSADGTQIAFKIGPGDNADLAIVSVATKKVTPMLTDKVPDTTPAWGPR